MNIIIKTIPHNKQRYNTCGDWKFDEDTNLVISVSEMPKTGWKGSAAIAVHELVEALLCIENGITTDMVDGFDLNYDPESDVEPGDDPDCPYRKEHNIATGIERILVGELGLDWTPYDNEVIELTEQYEDNRKGD